MSIDQRPFGANVAPLQETAEAPTMEAVAQTAAATWNTINELGYSADAFPGREVYMDEANGVATMVNTDELELRRQKLISDVTTVLYDKEKQCWAVGVRQTRRMYSRTVQQATTLYPLVEGAEPTVTQVVGIFDANNKLQPTDDGMYLSGRVLPLNDTGRKQMIARLEGKPQAPESTPRPSFARRVGAVLFGAGRR